MSKNLSVWSLASFRNIYILIFRVKVNIASHTAFLQLFTVHDFMMTTGIITLCISLNLQPVADDRLDGSLNIFPENSNFLFMTSR